MYEIKIAKLRCKNCNKLFGDACCTEFIQYHNESFYQNGVSQFQYGSGIMYLFCSDQCKLEWAFAQYEDLQD